MFKYNTMMKLLLASTLFNFGALRAEKIKVQPLGPGRVKCRVFNCPTCKGELEVTSKSTEENNEHKRTECSIRQPGQVQGTEEDQMSEETDRQD